MSRNHSESSSPAWTVQSCCCSSCSKFFVLRSWLIYWSVLSLVFHAEPVETHKRPTRSDILPAVGIHPVRHFLLEMASKGLLARLSRHYRCLFGSPVLCPRSLHSYLWSGVRNGRIRCWFVASFSMEVVLSGEFGSLV